MKNVLSLILVFILGVVLTGCLPKKISEDKSEETQVEEVSEDDSLEVIEEEIEDTELEEFEAELDALDEEINQL